MPYSIYRAIRYKDDQIDVQLLKDRFKESDLKLIG